MSDSQFDIVLKGVLPGFDTEQAKADFAALFALDLEKVARLFTVSRAVLKAGVDERTANKYTTRLAGIGVAAAAEAAAQPAAAPVVESPVAPQQATVEPVAAQQAVIEESVIETPVVEAAVAEEVVVEEAVIAAPALEESVIAEVAAEPVAVELAVVDDVVDERAALEAAVFEEAAALESAAAVEPDAPAAPLASEPIYQPESDDVPPADSDAQDAPEPPSIQRHEFVFTGSGFEYFKIWIVNLLLNILTIGIYSAWAKVRNKQYFYGNTQIDGSSFEYTAQPLKILVGRVIAVVLYGALFYTQTFAPKISLILSLVFLVFIPWIIVSSLRFNARHSSYRNIPFRFQGSVLGAFVNFLIWPLLGIFSLFLLMPLAWKKQVQYITNNHSYGTEPFHFDVSVKAYYKMLGILLGASIVFFVALGIFAGPSIKEIILQGKDVDPTVFLKLVPMVIAYLFFNFVVGAYLVSTMANIHFNNTSLQEHTFESDWTTLSYLSLTVTNTLGILLTLGLFIPFAKVRTAAYRAEHLSLMAAGSLDDFVARELDQSSSVGEGVHDIFDIDISI